MKHSRAATPRNRSIPCISILALTALTGGLTRPSMAVEQGKSTANSTDARRELLMKKIVSQPFKNDSAMISTVPFALSAYWLNERLPEADAAVIRVASPEAPGVGSAKDEQGKNHYFRQAYMLQRVYFLFHSRSEYSPVIIETTRKSDYPTFAAFQDAILKNQIDRKDSTLDYQSGHCATKLTLHTDYSKPPERDGVPINYSPARCYDSPFIQGDWGSGVVTLQKGEQKLVLDFNKQQP